MKVKANCENFAADYYLFTILKIEIYFFPTIGLSSDLRFFSTAVITPLYHNLS